MPITALPTPPTRSDPENFAERADAFLAALPNFVMQANALQAENEVAASAAATTAAQAVLNSKANLSGAAFTGDISTTGKLTVTGNIGQSITPSASWWASMRAHEIGRAGNGVFGSTSDDEVNVSANVINTGSGTYVYGASDTASLYRQVAGQHVWYAAAAGTAGAAIPLVELGRFSSSGNFGIGVVPGSARLDVRSANSGAEVVAQFGNATQIGPLQIITDSNTEWGFNTLNSRDLIFKTNQTERARMTAAGTTLLGQTASRGTVFARLQVNDSHISITAAANGIMGGIGPASSASNSIDLEADPDNVAANSFVRITVDGAEAARIDSNKNLLVGVTSGASHLFSKAVAEGGAIFGIQSSTVGISSLYVSAAGATGESSSASVLYVRKNSSTGRSINAAGTINASGADYAEYMTKTATCGVLDKGQIVGVDAHGNLTDKWSESISFLVKSTNPSYVGGDVWGSDEALGMSRPDEPQFMPPAYTGATSPGEAPVEPDAIPDDATDEQIAAYSDALDVYRTTLATWDSARAIYELDQSAHEARLEIARQIFDTATYPAYEQELATFNAALEAARQKVDRIAYCGQVPVNVRGATPGQYIVPVQDGDGIAGMLVNDEDITFVQYRRAVGIVQNILPDGRANVRVKGV